MSYAQPVTEKPKEKSNAVLIAAIVGGLIVFAVIARAASASTFAGVLIIFLAAALGLGSLVGKYARSAPPTVKRASEWLLERPKWLAIAVGILLAGGLFGISLRQKAVTACEQAVAHAKSLKEQGHPPADQEQAFNSAAVACDKADLAREVEAMQAERVAAEKQAHQQEAAEKERQAAARKAAQVAALDKARAAAQAGKHADAVAEFTKASQLGDLPAADKPLFAVALREHGKAELGAKKYAEAVAALSRAKDQDPSIQGVDEPLASATKQQRSADVKAWIDDALAISRDKGRCDTPKDISDCWSSLKTVTRDDALYPQAVQATAALERCRKATIATMGRGIREVMKMQREQAAERIDRAWLKEGMDVNVVTSGATAEQMTLTYVLFDRAWAFKITDGGDTSGDSFLGSLQKIGFKRVTFADGLGESWYYDLTPPPEDDKNVAQSFSEMGLDQPFKLP